MKNNTPITTRYLTFPDLILNDENLSALDRLVFAVILLYDNGERGCFATNQTLAHIANCSTGALSKSIKKLHELTYIESNVPDAENGGRCNSRKVRSDLKKYKAGYSLEERSLVKKTMLPSKKDTLIYKEKKIDDKEEIFTIKNEKNMVAKLLDIPLSGKWELYTTIKKEYLDKNYIVWSVRHSKALITMCRNIHETIADKVKSINPEATSVILFGVFKIIIANQPLFFTDSRPATFVRFWDSVIQQTKVKNAIDRLFLRSEKESYF